MPKSKQQYRITDEQYEKIEHMFREKRIAAGYKVQEDAAEGMGISQDLVSRVEHSFTPNMQIGHIGWMMRHYKIEPNTLFALMGMYAEPLPSSEERHIQREIVPLLRRMNRTTLSLVGNILKHFLEDEKEKPPTP